MTTGEEAVAAVDGVLRDLADRGALRSYAVEARGAATRFRFRWLREQQFDLRLDPARGELKVANFLREAPADPPMAAGLRRYLATFAAPDRPPHRRVPPERAALSVRTERGTIALVLRSADGDLAWATAAMIDVMNESYMLFLNDPIYYDYRVRVLNAHPDWG